MKGKFILIGLAFADCVLMAFVIGELIGKFFIH
jgi:hypothetical protein